MKRFSWSVMGLGLLFLLAGQQQCPCEDVDEDGYCANQECDDTNPDVYPGAVETCDGVDQNCDGVVDDGVTTTYYLDADGDGYGTPNESAEACEPPGTHYVAEAGDCNDRNANVNPDANEVCNEVDDNCDGEIDGPDAQGAKVFFVDADGDGYGDRQNTVRACTQPEGTATNGEDCDDADPGVYPGATEICDGVDQDCDGSIDEDAEVITWYMDADGDGFGDSEQTVESCPKPGPRYVTVGGDCDDGNKNVSPGATEVCNGIDDNCDGKIDGPSAVDAQTFYQDKDHDGYGSTIVVTTGCTPPPSSAANSNDCNDADALTHPDAAEDCTDMVVDRNCNGLIGCDDPACGGAPSCQPGEVEDCGNGLDDDGDYAVDCRDPDCAGKDGCGTAACIDVQLGRQTGKPIYSGLMDGKGNDFAAMCSEEYGDDLSFSWTAPSTGNFTFSTEGSDFLTSLSLFLKNSAAESCLGDVAACSIEVEPPNRVEMAVNEGTVVNIVVDDYMMTGGNVALSIYQEDRLAITFNVTVPSNTPSGDTIYISGDIPALGSWNPAGFALNRLSNNVWAGTVLLDPGTEFYYKVTRGTWATVEKAADGSEVPNRYDVADAEKVLFVTVAKWADL